MKMTVRLLTICVFTFAAANPNDQTQIERYADKTKSYTLEVPGKDPITIIETGDSARQNWDHVSPTDEKTDTELKNLMTHIIHDVNDDRPRCYGPSCQEGFDDEEGPQNNFEDELMESEKRKDYRDFSKDRDRLQAISDLAAKLKKDKLNTDRYASLEQDEEDDNGKVYTSWNKLKVKKHKHPYDDKDGWVTLEPVAWSTSKISKWKPNVKKQKPNHWNNDEDRFPDEDTRYPSFQNSMSSSFNFNTKHPTLSRPGFLNNNKLHSSIEYETEMPSKPSWTKPHQTSYPSTWSPDDSRRPQKPNCDHEESYNNDGAVYYGISDSVVTDNRPPNFPYEYQALHQTTLHRPYRRPTQVVYAGTPDLDGDRSSRPPNGDGQWVLLSTTKGYRNKKRQRSLTPTADDRSDYSSLTSHQAVALTVLPVDNDHTNMTTSHGGLLEVEKTFQTVDESKRDMDLKNDLSVSASSYKPVFNRVIKRRIVSNVAPGPDSSTVLAAVGAGMVPAAMAMMVPMMLGRRKKRDVSDQSTSEEDFINKILLRYE